MSEGGGDSNNICSSSDPLPRIEVVAIINDDNVKDKTVAKGDKPTSVDDDDKQSLLSRPNVLATTGLLADTEEGSGGTVVLTNGNAPGSSGSSPSQPQKKTPQDFVFGRMIGDGSFSSVYLAKDVKTGKEYAIKVCDKHHIIRERKAESIKREKEVLSILSANTNPTAPFFVHLYATFQDTQRLYFVMTLAHGGELLKYLNKLGCFNKELCQFYAGEIIQALKQLHKLGICHRDLKPENILLNDSGHILVTDFGSAKIMTSAPPIIAPKEQVKSEAGSRTRSNSFVGTAQYVSPEVLQGRYSEVGPAADLWALGCIIFQFLSGHPPFQAPNEFLIFRKILSVELAFPENFDEDAKDLILKLLKLEPSERLGALDKELYTSIQTHTYFSGIEFEALYQQEAPMISAESAASLLKPQPGIPSTYEPGFDPRTIAERFLRNDDLPWEEDTHVSSDESEESTKSQPVISSNRDESETVQTTELLNTLNIEGQNRCNSDCIVGPPRRFSQGKVAFPSDAKDRVSRLEEQAKSNPWHKSVKGNLILKQGLVSKRKGLFSRRRMLLLTEGPHLYYCDPSSKNVKGEIPWSSTMKPEAKDFKIFYIHTPHRIYYLEDPEGYALSWCDAINVMIQQTYEGKDMKSS